MEFAIEKKFYHSRSILLLSVNYILSLTRISHQSLRNGIDLTQMFVTQMAIVYSKKVC